MSPSPLDRLLACLRIQSASPPVGQHPDDEARDLLDSIPQLLVDTDEAIARHWDTRQSLHDDRRRASVMTHIDRLLDLRWLTETWLGSGKHRKT